MYNHTWNYFSFDDNRGSYVLIDLFIKCIHYFIDYLLTYFFIMHMHFLSQEFCDGGSNKINDRSREQVPTGEGGGAAVFPHSLTYHHGRLETYTYISNLAMGIKMHANRPT